MLISMVFSLVFPSRADQGYRWPPPEALPAAVREWLPEARACDNDLAGSNGLPHRRIVKLAGLPRVILLQKIDEMVPRDRIRLFNYVLRARLGGKRGALLRTRGHDLRAEYNAFFRDLRRAGLPQSAELTLLRQAMEFATFDMDPLVVRDLDFDPNAITQVFAQPSSLRTIIRLRQIGLWDRLDNPRRARILGHLLEGNGWMILGAETHLLDADRPGLFRIALASRGTRENPRSVASIREYLASPTLEDRDREALFEIAIQRNMPGLTENLVKALDRLRFSAAANLRIKTSILNTAPSQQVLQVLEHAPAGLTEPVILAAIRRLVAGRFSSYHCEAVLRSVWPQLRSHDGRFLVLNELVTLAPSVVLAPENISRFEISPEDVYRLFMRAPSNQADQIFRDLRQRFGAGFVPRLELSRDPRAVLAGARANEFVPVADLKANLANFQRTYPDSVSEREAELPWDLVWREDTGLKIIKHLMSRPPGDRTPYANSREIVSELLFGEIRPDFVDGLARVSDDRAGTLYELVLGAVSDRAPPMLPPHIKIDPEIWRKKQFPRFVEFLTSLRDWELVNMRAPENIRTAVTPANVDQLTIDLREGLVDEIRDKFGRGSLEISVDTFVRLRDLWGDLHPIFTLSSRYLGEKRWRPSLDILTRVFTTELAGRFTTYKYEGFPGDARDRAAAATQLHMLDSPDRLKAWRTNHARAKAVFADRGQPLRSPADLRAVAIAGIRNGLAGHVRLERIKARQADQDEFLKRVPKPREVRLDNAGISREDVASILLTQIIGEPADELIQAYTTFLLRHWMALKLDQQVYEDLRSIRAAYVTEDLAAGVQVIVTTSFDDAKSLLMIGDLVQTSSCQNYKTGGLAQTLPSYVIDANVKGIASFALKATHFANANDFASIIEMLGHEEDKLEIVYDGGHRRFVFTAPDGRSVTSLTVEKAHLRRILRIGTNKRTGGPGLFLEQSYQQSHDWRQVMHAQTASIVNEYHRTIDTDDYGTIRVEKTRNPLGAWSDAVWGVRQSAIEVSKKQN